MKFKKHILLMISLVLFSLTTSGCTSQPQVDVLTSFEQSLSGVSDLTDGQIPHYARIVAVGEATYGTKEVWDIRQQMLSTLTKKQDFRLFALEGDFGGAQVVNDYIVHDKGTATDAAYALKNAIYETSEMVDFIQWLHDYNDSVSNKKKIHFYGFDMQHVDVTKERLFTYCDTVASPEWAQFKQDLSFISDANFLTYSKEQLGQGLTLLDDLMVSMYTYKEDFIAATSKNDFKMACQSIEVLQQHLIIQGEESPIAMAATRNRLMSENIQWILDYELPAANQKLFIAAHNTSIAKWRNHTTDTPDLGHYLDAAFQEQYFAIGTDFYTGTFNVMDLTLDKRTNYEITNTQGYDLLDTFNTTDYDTAYFNFTTALQDTELSTLLAQPWPMIRVGDNFSSDFLALPSTYLNEVVPTDCYDGIIFSKTTSPTTPLN